MSVFTRLACTTALTVIVAAQPAAAEVSADDVWQNTRDIVAALGGNFSVAKARRGDTLTISDMRMTFQLPFDIGDVSMTFPDLQLIENGDGTVSFAYPKTSTYGIAVKITGKGSFTGNLNMVYDNLRYVASGNPGDVTYTYSVDKVTFETTDIVIEGGALPDKPSAISVNGVLLGMAGTSRVKVASLITVESEMTIDSQDTFFAAEFPDGTSIEHQATVKNQSGVSNGTLPRGGMDILNLAAALRSGLSMSGTTSTGFYETRQISKTGGDVVSDQITSLKRYSTEVEFNKAHLKATGHAEENTVTIGKNEFIPFPFSIFVKSTEFAMEIPLSAAPELQNFGLSLDLTGVKIPDSIIAMFDPEHALPNDPATFSIDLSGKVKNLIDWLDIETVMALGSSEQPPVEIHALTLGTLVLDLAGAHLTGHGAATFDNSDVATGGMPKPSGTLDLSLIGGNTLLDTLVGIGLMTEEQAMGARLGIATITRPDPDAGKDALKTKLEINEQGHITANGMRIK